MWYVYILECEDKSLYTGCTNDLKRRFEQHREGIGSKYTSSHKPIKILFSEECGSRSNALKRECQIKGWSHAKKLKFIQIQKMSG
jgi:putative endonuclease